MSVSLLPFVPCKTKALERYANYLRNLVWRFLRRLAAGETGVRRNVLIVSSDYTFASFLERALGPDVDVHSAATDVAAFARFQEGIGERCAEAPVTVEIEEVGSYGM